MKMRPDKPSDVVFGAALNVIEDMLEGVNSYANDLSTYNNVFTNMARALLNTKANLTKHTLEKRWLTKEERRRTKMRIRQIDAIIDTCAILSSFCRMSIDNLVKEMSRMERKAILRGILKSLPKPKQEDPPKED